MRGPGGVRACGLHPSGRTRCANATRAEGTALGTAGLVYAAGLVRTARRVCAAGAASPPRHPEQPCAETEGDEHAGHAGQAGRQVGVAKPPDAVVGQWAVLELVALLLL